MEKLEIELSTEKPISHDSLLTKTEEIKDILHGNNINYTVQINPSIDPEHYNPEGINILKCTIQDFKRKKRELKKIYGILEGLGYKIMNKVEE